MPRPIGKDLSTERLGVRLVLLNAYVFGVRRVNSSDLLKQGFPTLEGSGAYSKMLKEHRHAIEEIEAGLKDPRLDEATKEQIRADLRAARERQQESLADVLVGDPDKAVAFLDRCRAYLCAMVVSAGRLLPEAEAAAIGIRGVPRLVRSDWPIERMCEDLRTPEEIEAGEEPCYMAPFRFVMSEDEADPNNNVVWVHAYDNRETAGLGTVLMGLQEVAGNVTATFRGGS